LYTRAQCTHVAQLKHKNKKWHNRLFALDNKNNNNNNNNSYYGCADRLSIKITHRHIQTCAN